MTIHAIFPLYHAFRHGTQLESAPPVTYQIAQEEEHMALYHYIYSLYLFFPNFISYI